LRVENRAELNLQGASVRSHNTKIRTQKSKGRRTVATNVAASAAKRLIKKNSALFKCLA